MRPALKPDGRSESKALVGDEGVGKSSLITSLIKESFVDLPARSVLPLVTIAGDAAVHSPSLKNLTFVIADTSRWSSCKPRDISEKTARRADRGHLENAIRKAHVIICCYAIDDPSSFVRVPEYWLPTIRSLGVNVPIILVGNKIDLRTDSDGATTGNQSLEDEVFPIMQNWKEIETCVECSAKSCTNIAEIFYFSQRAVTDPTAPLYDSREHTLKLACVNALRRIFKLCDLDKDGLLSDGELNGFQRKCFNASLQQSELEGIKDIVRSVGPDAIVEDKLSEAGFLYLHTIFIQKGRMETTWTVLRSFGYGEDLTLREDFVSPKFDVPSDCSVELTPSGYAFLTDLFERYDKDKDGALSPDELVDLFSTSPGNPWQKYNFPQSTVTNDMGFVTLQGWLSQWSMTTLLEHRTTLAYLAYLGYQSSSTPPKSITTGLTATLPRKAEFKVGKSKRQVFTALLLGAAGSGKTSTLRAFVGRDPRSFTYTPTNQINVAVNTVEIKGAEKHLVLQEFGREEPEILRNSKRLASIDVVVYVYDSADTNSFSYISNLRQQYRLDHIPSLFVATKSDLDLATQRHEVQPDVYCRRLSLRAPVAINQYDQGELYQIICGIAMSPKSALPGGAEKALARSRWLGITAAVCGGSLLTFLLYKTWNSGYQPLSFLNYFRSSFHAYAKRDL